MKNLPEGLEAAYFDVDGTLSKSNIVNPLLYIKKMVMSRSGYMIWRAVLPFRFLYWTVLDKISRKRSTAAIYNQYKGISVEKMKLLIPDCYHQQYQKKLFTKAIEVVRSLQEKGIPIVLVSGSLDLFLNPLAKEFGAELLCSSLEVKNGMYTGKVKGPVVSGIQKAVMIDTHASKNKINLEKSISFGDSADDLPMLRSVRYAVAINPDRILTLAAEKNQWNIEKWF
ncbi:HAD family phosphatase [Chryseobacterium sp. MYb264]|uniref:HAD family hydrolase n=1 Tax=Chryseobacterium sp. MYb264 TaxID=2745153 RepID=UPI002E0D84AD|nr:HAD family phosphatase [Chryseobacterium sp. MYb264]